MGKVRTPSTRQRNAKYHAAVYVANRIADEPAADVDLRREAQAVAGELPYDASQRLATVVWIRGGVATRYSGLKQRAAVRALDELFGKVGK